MAVSTLHNQGYAERSWPIWPLHTALVILFIGPIIAPLFRMTGLPLISDAGMLAHDVLTRYICPTPERSYLVGALPMAVCARCWGATIGLWLARMLVGKDRDLWSGRKAAGFGWLAAFSAWFLALAWPVRLLLCALPFVLWPLEIMGAAAGWWFAPLWLLLLNGVQAGCAAGLFFCSLWPGFWARRV